MCDLYITGQAGLRQGIVLMKSPLHLQDPHDIPLIDYMLGREHGIMNKFRCLLYGLFSPSKRRAVVMSALYSLCCADHFPSTAERERFIKEMNITLSRHGITYPMSIYYRIWEGLQLKPLSFYDVNYLANRLSKRVPFCFRYASREVMRDDIVRLLKFCR